MMVADGVSLRGLTHAAASRARSPAHAGRAICAGFLHPRTRRHRPLTRLIIYTPSELFIMTSTASEG
eukprot:83342-Alexandrium_andersonii.AAC.1